MGSHIHGVSPVEKFQGPVFILSDKFFSQVLGTRSFGGLPFNSSPFAPGRDLVLIAADLVLVTSAHPAPPDPPLPIGLGLCNLHFLYNHG